MAGSSVRNLLFVFVASLCLVSSAEARPRSGVIQKTAHPRQTYTALGETVFDCGTYKGNESEIRGMQLLHAANQKQSAQKTKALTTGLDYVFDNVWVIEDDGTLTVSGTNLFDTDNQTHKYTRSGTAYSITSQAFSYDATLGTLLAPGDDGAVLVNLPFAFPYAGTTYTQMYVSGNGAVSFGAPINGAFFDPNDFLSTTPKIAPYYLDLDETANGDVRVRSEATKYTVSWINVFEYGQPASNTFQLVLFPNGDFTITYNGIGSNVGSLTGFHPGGSPTLEEISFSSGLPHTSAAGAAVFEQYYSYTNPLVDEAALFHRFYAHFPDEFFQLIFFTNFNQTMAGFANEVNISNDVTGIGLNIFDSSGSYGSSGVLESRCNMNNLDAWASPDPAARVFGKGNNFLTIMGQEAGHRWGAFVTYGPSHSNLILGRSDAHWSYYADLDHSSLEGGDWVSTGGNNYTCPTNIDYFSEIDEYLFGLRTPNEVKDFFFISSASNNTVNARSVGTPVLGSVATGAFVPVTVEDIITSEGPRTPVVADEQHVMRQGFIFLIKQGTVPTQAQLDKV
ncbi:MAG TPA: hypothetical protein VFH33_08505, partial [Candidatus Krumholzibacteria bacterium]|nr:hypothetical protein [Candidatus Krumholzibacteria bacterium]